MDKIIKTILPSKKIFNSDDKDLFIDLEIKSNETDLPLTENINTILNLSELLTTEREESKKYYLNGTVEVLAPFINSVKNPKKVNKIANNFKLFFLVIVNVYPKAQTKDALLGFK